MVRQSWQLNWISFTTYRRNIEFLMIIVWYDDASDSDLVLAHFPGSPANKPLAKKKKTIINGVTVHTTKPVNCFSFSCWGPPFLIDQFHELTYKGRLEFRMICSGFGRKRIPPSRIDCLVSLTFCFFGTSFWPCLETDEHPHLSVLFLFHRVLNESYGRKGRKVRRRTNKQE